MRMYGIGGTHRAMGFEAKRPENNATGKNFTEQMGKAASAKPRVYTVYAKTDDMLYSGGNGTGLSFYIKYAKDSTEEDPTVIAKGVDENGEEFEQTIHINDINPNCATIVEMRALEAYTGVEKQNGFTSLPMETGSMGLNDRRNFMDMFQKQIRDMTVLNQKYAVEYYRYSMESYWDFWNNR